MNRQKILYYIPGRPIVQTFGLGGPKIFTKCLWCIAWFYWLASNTILKAKTKMNAQVITIKKFMLLSTILKTCSEQEDSKFEHAKI